MFEHYLKCFINEKQINWANLLSLTKFINNNNLHNFADVTSFYLIYKYYSEIWYEVENNFFKEKILLIKNCVEQLQSFQKNFEKRLKKVAKYQTKYYDKSNKLKKFVVNELILLSIQNFNQKRLNKKYFLNLWNRLKLKKKLKSNHINWRCRRLIEFIIFFIFFY